MERKTPSEEAGERYLAHLAHELRTPLNAIIGYADAMRARLFGPLNERYGEYVEVIHAAGRHMLDLAEDLLARASLGEPGHPGVKEVLDPAEPAAWALHLLRLEAEAAGVALGLIGPNVPVLMTLERRAIAQIVMNLVGNALRYTPEGGAIEVRLVDEVHELLLEVRDNGAGMAPGSEQAGRGLGLVRELIETHGGVMDIVSEIGRGTSVTLRLPKTGEPR